MKSAIEAWVCRGTASSQEAETRRFSDIEEILVFRMSARTERACRDFPVSPPPHPQITVYSFKYGFTFYHVSAGI